jgi:hypothetical protein
LQDNLPPIDRWNSNPLDVHKWSDHPEIKELADRLYVEIGVNLLDKDGNRKARRTARDMLRVLLIDLYVNWLNDSSRAIGFSKNNNSYVVKSRYNQVFISHKIIKVEALLHQNGWVDELDFYHDKTGKADSYTTRIRASQKLRDAFKGMTVDLYDIHFDVDREVIILREKFEDEDGQTKKVNLEYTDTDYTNRIREQLQSYNALIRRSFIDIPSLAEPVVRRRIEKGKRKGQEAIISVGPDNKHVHRVFNGTEADNWSKGGRFYGGWWLQIPKEMRRDIFINDRPTVEVDYKALHPNLLLNEPVYDPYDLGELVLPELITTLSEQRTVVKSLVLMAINATSADKAYSAFRRARKTNDPYKKLKNPHLQALLDAFSDKYPELKGKLTTGQALGLMNLDSQIANLVIDYFTQQGIPVLCIHDSFVIQHDKESELKQVLHNASVQIAGKGIDQDKTSNERKIKTYVQGNIKGYEVRKAYTLSLPNKAEPTEQYNTRKSKFYKWLENSKEEYVGSSE